MVVEPVSRGERKRKLEHLFAQNFNTLAYPLLAECYLSEGDLARARKVCTIGLDRHPHHAPGLFLLATLAIRNHRLEEAEDLLQQTLARDPYHIEAAELQVAVRERLKRKRSALEQAYKQLLQANPLHRGALERLNRIRAEQEMLEEVQAELRVKEGGAPKGARRSGSDRARPTAGKAAPTGMPEGEAAELTWEANIKRVAAAEERSGSKGADSSGVVKKAEPDSTGPDVAMIGGPQETAAAPPHEGPGPENDPDPLPDTLPEALKTAFLPIDEGRRGGETEDEGTRDADRTDPFQARASKSSWAGSFLGERLETETPPETGVAVAPAVAAGEWLSPDAGSAPEPEGVDGTVMVAEQPLDDSDPEAPAFEPGETTLQIASDQPGEKPTSGDLDTALQDESPQGPEDWNLGDGVEDGQEQQDEGTSDDMNPEGYADRPAGETPGNKTAQAEGLEDRATDPLAENPFQPGEATEPAEGDTLMEEPTLADTPETGGVDGPSAPDDVSPERSEESGQGQPEATASEDTVLEGFTDEVDGETPGHDQTADAKGLEDRTIDLPAENPFQPGEVTVPAVEDTLLDEPTLADTPETGGVDGPSAPDDVSPERSEESGQGQPEATASEDTVLEGFTDEVDGETPGHDQTADAKGLEDRTIDLPAENPFQPGEVTVPAVEDTLLDEPTLADTPETGGVDGPSAPEDVSPERNDESGQEFMEGVAPDDRDTEDDHFVEGEAAGPTDSENGEDLEAVATDQAVTGHFQPGEAATAETEELPDMPAPPEAADDEALATPNPTAATIGADPGPEEMAMEGPATESLDKDEAPTESGDTPATAPVSVESPHGEGENSMEMEESPFQPGAATAEGVEGSPPSRKVDTGTEESDAAEGDTFTPGEPPERAESGDGPGTEAPSEMEDEPMLEAGALPGAEMTAHTEAVRAGEPADDLPDIADTTDAFEVDDVSSAETAPGVDDEPTDVGSTDIEESLLAGPPDVKDAPALDKTGLESKDLADESAQAGLTADEDSGDEGASGESHVAAEDKDLETEPFEPGDTGDASEEGAPETETGAKNLAEAARQEGEPYRPDVASVEKATHGERDELEKAAHAGRDMPGERFDPVAAKPSAGDEEGGDDTQPPEPEPRGAQLGDEAATSDDTLQIDPHLATFTLATIYKVQGLYRQALQVLDMLEAKSADQERIQGERESIQQFMISDSPSE